eukprot:290324-Chlamydomonas_euryale.AAC.2
MSRPASGSRARGDESASGDSDSCGAAKPEFESPGDSGSVKWSALLRKGSDDAGDPAAPPACFQLPCHASFGRCSSPDVAGVRIAGSGSASASASAAKSAGADASAAVPLHSASAGSRQYTSAPPDFDFAATATAACAVTAAAAASGDEPTLQPDQRPELPGVNITGSLVPPKPQPPVKAGPAPPAAGFGSCVGVIASGAAPNAASIAQAASRWPAASRRLRRPARRRRASTPSASASSASTAPAPPRRSDCERRATARRPSSCLLPALLLMEQRQMRWARPWAQRRTRWARPQAQRLTRCARHRWMH